MREALEMVPSFVVVRYTTRNDAALCLLVQIYSCLLSRVYTEVFSFPRAILLFL